MTELLLAAALAASTGAGCCPPQPAAAVFAAPNRSKEMIERVGHFVSPMILTPSFYGAALYLGAEPKQARWIAAGLSVALVIAKEVYDERVAGRFGVEEAFIGLAGTAAGVWLADEIEWPEEKQLNSNRTRTNRRR